MNGKMNNPKIVLFGPDNSGKTTLANNLILSFSNSGAEGLPPLGPAPYEKQIDRMEEIATSEKFIVIDRWPILEEEVCGRILRGKNNFDMMPRELWDNYYKNISLFIYCNPSIDVIKDWGNREQMGGIKENIFELKKGYDAIYNSLLYTPYNVYKYNWTNDRTGYLYHKLIKTIKNILEVEEN